MKKFTLIAITLFLVISLTPQQITAKQQHLQNQPTGSLENPQYKLVLETIFAEEDLPKIKKALVEVYAPFEITSVDYKTKTIVIQMTQKAPFDDVKQALDKIGLRITKDELVK